MTTLPEHALSYPTATSPNDPTNRILLVFSIISGILMITIAIIKCVDQIIDDQKQQKKSNEFTKKMIKDSENLSRLREKILPVNDRNQHHTGTLSNDTTTTRVTQTDTTNPSTVTTAETQEDVQQNRKQESIVVKESSKVESQMIPVQKLEQIEEQEHKRLESTV